MVSSPTGFHLRLRGNDIWLATGDYFLGRSVGCHLVLDDSLVSRRHAQLVVSSHRVTLADLRSSNGTFVNGERLLDGARVLSDGDLLTLGDVVIEFFAKAELLVPEDAELASVSSGGWHELAADFGHRSTAFDEEDRTYPGDRFSLAAQSAEKALQSGHAEHAEHFLGPHLATLLSEARAGRVLVPTVIDEAMNQALHLASQTKKGGWLDYAVNLLRATRMLPSPTVRALMAEVAQWAPVDRLALWRFQSELQASRQPPGGLASPLESWVGELSDLVENSANGAPPSSSRLVP